ncbi:inactive peptidyl-prolyl cis-trans isomerase shutdown-like [Arctopsyche grandis]|uniref:inactive peptidyl-prolyl cis-trans isomerase shutdown-like n=1 Tax=Arctopsyche grandis TaxID=121162 RepID=UPI00406D982B
MEEIVGIQNGISINALVDKGITFDISNIQDAIDDVIAGDDDDFDTAHGDGPSSVYFDPFGKYIKEPFNKLWKRMEPIGSNNLIRKLIVKEGFGERPTDDSTLKIFYCGYFDGQNVPFTSNKKSSPWAFYLNDSGLLPGMDIAIRSMIVGEQSRFLIHHSLMYGELGCPPHIPKEAMCLIHFVLLSSKTATEVTEDETCGGLPKLNSVFEKAKNMHKEGVNNYNCMKYSSAISSFKKAMQIVLHSRLSDDKEEKMQQEILGKIYLNLAICYNAKKLPLRACSMCNDYAKIHPIWKNWKILFQNGRALIMIGCFKDARKKLVVAHRLNSSSQEIKNMIQLLDEKESIYKKYEVHFFKYTSALENSNCEVDKKILEEFENEVELLCTSIKNDEGIDRMQLELSPSMSCTEINVFKNIIAKNGLSFEFKENSNLSDNKHVTIIKERSH